MGLIRDSFVIFKNWADAINALPDEYQLETYKALVQYGISGEMPQGLSPVASAMLISFSVGMENSICRYSASVENGKLGGRPPKNKNLEEPNKTQQNLDKPRQTQVNQQEPTNNLNVNDNVNENVNVNDNILKRKNKKEKSDTALVDSELVVKEILTDDEVINYIKANISDETVCKKFIDFANNRKAMGKKYAIRTKTTIDINLKNLRKWSKNVDDAIAILDYSIANNYQGLFAPKDKTTKQDVPMIKHEKVSSLEANAWE